MALSIREFGFDYTIEIPDSYLPVRLEDCKTYRSISGRGFKDMEAIWFRPEQPNLYMMELKNWFDDTNPKYKEVNPEGLADTEVYVRDELAKKVVDVLYLITQNRPLIDVKQCVNNDIITHLKDSNKIILLFVIGARPDYNLLPVKTVFCKELNKIFYDKNLNFEIPNDNIYFISREKFRDGIAQGFGLIIKN